MNEFADYLLDRFFPGWTSSRGLLAFFLTGLAVGAAVRLGMHWFVELGVVAGDAEDYLACARNLVNWHVFSPDAGNAPVSTCYRPPFYSFFLASVMAAFGERLWVLQLAQAAVSLGTGLLATHIAARVLPAAAPLVFLMMMLSPFEAVYTGVLLSECLTSFLLVASACALLTLEGTKRWVVGGALFGLTVLTRDVYWPLLVPASLIWLIWGEGMLRKRCREVLLMVLCFCLVVAPWTLRNYQLTHRFIPVSEGRLGLSLWFGTWTVNGEFTKAYLNSDRPVYPPEAYRNEGERRLVQKAQALGKEGDHIYRALAMGRVHDEPLKVLKRYLVREPLLWVGTRFDIFKLNEKVFPRGSHPWKAAKVTLWVLNFLGLTLGLVGMALSLKERRAVAVLMLPVLFTALIYLPFNSFEARYSQPVYPFLLIFAALAVCQAVERAMAKGIAAIGVGVGSCREH